MPYSHDRRDSTRLGGLNHRVESSEPCELGIRVTDDIVLYKSTYLFTYSLTYLLTY